jgi:hypothetical protein
MMAYSKMYHLKKSIKLKQLEIEWQIQQERNMVAES